MRSISLNYLALTYLLYQTQCSLVLSNFPFWGKKMVFSFWRYIIITVEVNKSCALGMMLSNPWLPQCSCHTYCGAWHVGQLLRGANNETWKCRDISSLCVGLWSLGKWVAGAQQVHFPHSALLQTASRYSFMQPLQKIPVYWANAAATCLASYLVTLVKQYSARSCFTLQCFSSFFATLPFFPHPCSPASLSK